MKKVLTIPVYDIKIQLQVTKRFLEAVSEAGWDGPVCGGGAVVLHYPDSPGIYSVIFQKGCTSPGIIAHEAYHLTRKIMYYLDLEDSITNQETGAYLNGFIVDLIYQAINK